MKQTAVEWLINELQKTRDWQRVINEVNQSSTSVRNVLEQAKEMEKAQICGFVRDFIDDKCYASFDGYVRCNGTPEGYFDETFNTNEK